ISKEIFPHKAGWKLYVERVVKSAARDCATCYWPTTVRVNEERRAKQWIVCEAFGIGPAVVRTSDAVVDLLPGILADVIDEHSPRAGLNGERERVAQTKRPDRTILAGGRVEEWIVDRNAAVGIEAQHLAETIVECLRV